jgi:dynactin 1
LPTAKLETDLSGVASGAQHTLETEIVQVEGNLETSHLLEQIDTLRGTVRFLRTENGYLKGQDMLRELRSLPPLDIPSKFYVPSSTPPLVPDIGSDDDAPASPKQSRPRVNGKKTTATSPPVHEESPVTVKKGTSLRALSTETKLLYRELLDYSASPKMVDLQSLDAAAKKGWVPQRKTAAHQLWERKREGEKLSRRVKGLMEKVDNVRMTALPL